MNTAYQLILNEITGTWVAVAETVKRRGRRASSVLLCSAVSFAGIMDVRAQSPPAVSIAPTQLPTGGKLVAGEAAITQHASDMTVTQSSNRAVLDWATFDLGSQASISFLQPSANAAILNRILDTNPSQIFGHINSNGQVFLTNPNGIYFGRSASADVGALTATTHGISNADFMGGILNFQRLGATGKVVNEGRLSTALGGYIALLAPEVRNNGVIVAQMGTVVMAAGEAYSLQFDASNKLANIIVSPASINTLVENRLAVQAPGGLVILSAQALNTLQGSVVNSAGAIEARGIDTSGGVIRLEAGNGQTTVSGTLDVSSRTDHGGKIVATGQQILVADGAKLTATGATGGGTVLIGGDWQGSGDTPQATHVTMQQSATIDASATQQGDGGKVVLWSTGTTDFAGHIDAKGVGTGQRGGNAEVSGKTLLNYKGFTNLLGGSADLTGNLLIDPYNLYIVAGSGGAITATGNNSLLGVDTLTTQLGSANVTVSTGSSGTQSGIIGVMTGINSSSANNLTLSAAGNVVLGGNVNMGGQFTVNAGGDFVMGTDLSNGSGVTITANGGFVKIGSGTSYLTGNINTSNTAIDIGGPVKIANFSGSGNPITLSSGGGNITLSGAISAYSGTAQNYAVMMASKLYDGVTVSAVGGDVCVSYKTAGDNLFFGQYGLTNVRYLLVGGGGGSGGGRDQAFSGGGGGGGGVYDSNTTVTPGSSYVVTVGAAGVAGSVPYDVNSTGAVTISTNGGDSGLDSKWVGGGGGGGNSGSYVRWGSSGLGGYGENNKVAGRTYLAGGGGGGGGAGHMGSTGPNYSDYGPGGDAGTGTLRTAAPGQTGSDGGIGTHAGGNGGGALGSTTDGVTSGITGVDFIYGKGGFGLPSGGTAGVLGSGGTLAGYTTSPYVSDSQNGVVIVRYTVGNAATTATSALKLDTGGSSGTVAFSQAVDGVKRLDNLSVTAKTITMGGNMAINGNLTMVSQDAMTLGDIYATGKIDIASNGNLAITQQIRTDDVTSSAIILNAGSNTAAGTSTGGDITASSGGSLTYGGGNGRATLYTGSVSGSTTSAALAGAAGSGRFRYNSNATTPHYTSGLVTGTYEIYRERPTLTITANSPSAITYGSATPALSAVVTGVNGDTALQALSTQATVATDGIVSTSGKLTAATHTLTPYAVDQLGYTLSYVTGSLVVNKLALSGAAIAASGSTYASALAPGAVSFGNIVGSDSVSSAASVNTSTLSSSANFVAGSYTQTASATLTGSDKDNYSFGGFTSTSNYTINKLALNGAAIAPVATTYGTSAATGALTFSNKVGSDDVSSAVSIDSPLYSTSTHLKAGSYTQTASSTLAGTDASNYSFAGLTTPSNNYTVSQLALTLSGISAVNKEYDSNCDATVDTSGLITSGLISRDVVNVSATGLFDTKNVGTGKTVTLSSSYSGADGGNYTITGQGSSAANITPKALTLSGISAVNKEYDGNRNATFDTSGLIASGLISGDVVNVSATGLFDTKNVGTGKTVTLSSSYSGADVGNYTITGQGSSAANITPKALTLSGTSAASKEYDGNRDATVNTSGLIASGVISGDVVNVSATGLFDTKNVGTGKTVTLSISYSGADGDNYTIANSASSVANITAKPLTVKANNDAKFVTQSDTSTYNGANYIGLIPSEGIDVLGGSLTYTRTNASVNATGTYSGVIAPSGLTSSNYAISYANGDYTIVPADRLLVTLQNNSLTYGTAPAYTISSAKYLDGSNVIHTLANPSQSGNIYTYSDGVGGTAVFTLGPMSEQLSTTGQLKAGNYNIGATNITETSVHFNNNLVVVGATAIAQKSVTAMAGGATKTYDGNTSINNVALGLDGLLTNDVVTISGTGAFSQKGVGANLSYSISALSLSGIDAGNYYLSGGSTSSGSNGVITAKPLTITGITAANKTYDGNRVALVSTAGVTSGALQSGGMIAGDEVIVNATATFNDKNAAIGKTVSLSSTYSGLDASNYQIIDQTATLANITPKALVITGSTAANKVYDGSTAAVVLPGSLSGLIDAETITTTATGIFDSKNAGSHSASVSYTLIDGNHGGLARNYSLDNTTGLVATITKAPLTVTADNKTRPYGQANPPLTTSVSGFINGETASTADGFTGAGSGTTLADTNTPAGITPIIAGVGTLFATNYDFNHLIDGLLTIRPLQSPMVQPRLPPVLPPTIGNKQLATPDTDPPSLIDKSNSMTGDTESVDDDQACTKHGATAKKGCKPTK